MKSILGQDQLKWDTQKMEGCYAGKRAYEFNGSTQDGGSLSKAPQKEGHSEREQDHSDYTPSEFDQDGKRRLYGSKQMQALQQRCAENDKAPTSFSEYQPTDRVETSVAAKGGAVREVATPISDHRAMRPGAGYANKQSYNIFTGK